MVLGFGKWVAKKGGKKVSETITKVKPVTHGSGPWSGVSKEVSKTLISAHKTAGKLKRAEQKKWHQVHEAKQKSKKTKTKHFYAPKDFLK